MKQYIQQTIRQVVMLSIPLVLIGTLATASYTPPTNPPIKSGTLLAGDTAIVPLLTDNTAQEKLGGLALYTFIANGVANFDQDVFFGKQLNAGNPAASATVGALAVGDVTNTNNSVDLAVSGTVTALLGLQSDTLKNTTTQLVCAKKDGTIVLCGNLNASTTTTTIATTSYCLNIPGSTAASIATAHYQRDSSGNCTLIPNILYAGVSFSGDWANFIANGVRVAPYPRIPNIQATLSYAPDHDVDLTVSFVADAFASRKHLIDANNPGSCPIPDPYITTFCAQKLVERIASSLSMTIPAGQKTASLTGPILTASNVAGGDSGWLDNAVVCVESSDTSVSIAGGVSGAVCATVHAELND